MHQKLDHLAAQAVVLALEPLAIGKVKFDPAPEEKTEDAEHNQGSGRQHAYSIQDTQSLVWQRA
jgi:hypothetical protein